MSKGKAKVNYLGRSGVVMPQTVPSWSFIYETSTIKHSKYGIGDRVVLPDGRVFRYGYAGATCYSGQGCGCYKAASITSSAPAAEAAIGDQSVKATSVAALNKDELRGGYIIVFGASEEYTQFRGIIGNTKAGVTSEVTIYLDAPLTSKALTTKTIVVYHSPYADLRTYCGDYNSAVAGVAAVRATVGKYFWVQTWGPCRITPGEAGYGAEANERQLVFDPNSCALRALDYASDGKVTNRQFAGFIIDRQTPGSDGEPLFNLQINP